MCVKVIDYLGKLVKDTQFKADVDAIYDYSDLPVIAEYVNTKLDLTKTPKQDTGIACILDRYSVSDGVVEHYFEIFELRYNPDEQGFVRYSMDLRPISDVIDMDVVTITENPITDAEICEAIISELFFMELTDEDKEDKIDEIVESIEEVRNDKDSVTYHSVEDLFEELGVSRDSEESKQARRDLDQEMTLNGDVFKKAMSFVTKRGLIPKLKLDERCE